MAKKKISRKKLLNETDEFITFSAKLVQSVIRYKAPILGVLGVSIVLVLALSGMRYFSNRAEDKAFMLLEQAKAKYEQALKDQSAVEAFATVDQDFQAIVEQYSGKNAGKVAGVLYAHICYDAGKYDQAISLYNQMLQDFDDDPSLHSLILSGLGYCHEEKADYEKAIEYFEMIAAGSDSILKAEAVFNLGRLHASMGNHDQSMDAFKKIVSDYTDSIYFELAQERVAG